jgi:hypothetical protein
MTVGASEPTLLTVEAFKRALSTGQAPKEAIITISETMGVSRGAVRSRLRRQGLWGEPDFDKTSGRYRAGIHNADFKADRLIPPNPPVFRDPCQRCGARGDVACGHSKVRLGMVL